MKRLLTVLCCCLPIALFAQTIQVGDYVFVKKSTTHYSTGESISSWVYNEPHQVSQVDSKFHPDGILLNVRGAKSWLKVDDVLLCTPREVTAAPIIQPEIPVIVHDTIINKVETIKEIVKTDTIYQSTTEEYSHLKQASFQLDVALQAACGVENLGIGAHITVGGRFADAFFLGLGVGFEGSIYNLPNQQSPYTFQIPIYANTRVYFPINGVSPFIDLAAGVNVRELNYGEFTNKEWICGLYSRAGIGVEYNRWIFGAGYQFSGGSKTIQDNIHQGYIKVGFRFLDR